MKLQFYEVERDGKTERQSTLTLSAMKSMELATSFSRCSIGKFIIICRFSQNAGIIQKLQRGWRSLTKCDLSNVSICLSVTIIYNLAHYVSKGRGPKAHGSLIRD